MDSDYIHVFIPGHKMMPNAWHHKKLATIVSLMHLSSMGFLVHDQSLSRSLKSLIPSPDATIDFSTTPLPLRTQLPFHLVLPAHGYLPRTDALKHACCFFICKCKWPRCAQKAEKIINAVLFLIFEAIWKQERFSGVKKKKVWWSRERTSLKGKEYSIELTPAVTITPMGHMDAVALLCCGLKSSLEFVLLLPKMLTSCVRFTSFWTCLYNNYGASVTIFLNYCIYWNAISGCTFILFWHFCGWQT